MKKVKVEIKNSRKGRNISEFNNICWQSLLIPLNCNKLTSRVLKSWENERKNMTYNIGVSVELEGRCVAAQHFWTLTASAQERARIYITNKLIFIKLSKRKWKSYGLDDGEINKFWFPGKSDLASRRAKSGKALLQLPSASARIDAFRGNGPQLLVSASSVPVAPILRVIGIFDLSPSLQITECRHFVDTRLAL